MRGLFVLGKIMAEKAKKALSIEYRFEPEPEALERALAVLANSLPVEVIEKK